MVEEDSTRLAPISDDGLGAATEIMAAQHEVISIVPDDIITPVGPGDDDVAITPESNVEDVAITTPIGTFDDVLLTPLPPEDGATQFTPPPIFEEPEVTEPSVPLTKKKKFIATTTLPGIIAPKKKS